MSASKYKTLLIVDAPIYLKTQREFWKNCTLKYQGKTAIAISYSIKGVKVKITPQTLSEVFELNDLQGKTSFPKLEYQTDFFRKRIC
ncbi:hypothetical protein Hanom_Chr09g00783201 [Helianthus anomalus]